MRNGHGKIRTAENRRPFHTLKVIRAAALLSNESLPEFMSCVHVYIGGICDQNVSFLHFLVCVSAFLSQSVSVFCCGVVG